MKHLFFILTFLLFSFAYGQGKGKLQLSYSFSHIEVGYDHTTKCRVYIDDKLVFESEEHLQSEAQDLKLKIPRGSHRIRIVMLALYEGNWEEHIIENQYSTDAFLDQTINFQRKNQINMLFDLDKRQPIITISNS